MRSKYVNGNRSAEERRARYCFFTKFLGMTRTEARMWSGWSDRVVQRALEQRDTKFVS